MQPIKVSIFPNALAVGKPYYTTVESIVERIKNGSPAKKLIEKIRNTDDIAERRKLKVGLPSICFSGIFEKREEKSIISHTGLIAIDFDHLNGRLKEFKENICRDKHTFLAFISPSGDGLKIVIKIPANIETHKLSCAAIVDYYKEETLDSFQDVCRICFESYDPEIYYNPNSDVFAILKEEKIIKRTIETHEIITDFDDIVKRIDKWLEKKGEVYADGSKHKFLVKLASAYNRFGIPENVGVQKAIFNYIHKASSVDPKDFENIFKRVYKSYGNLSCTAHFNKEGSAIETITKTVLTDAIFDITIGLKDVIYLDSVRDSMLETFHSGRSRGQTTHFDSIDELFRLKRREITLFHGIGNHGKSIMVMQICVLLSIYEDFKWAVFSPEQDPPDDFYDDLIHMYKGKNTQPFYSNQMPASEYLDGMEFIKDHFYYIFPDSEIPTQEYINQRFEDVIKKHNVDGCIIDPYNQLDNDLKKNGGREDQYISSFLTIQKRFAQSHDIFMLIVAHPKGSLNKIGGNYECPNVYDLSGGAMWNNKCDNIVCIYRPFFTSDPKNAVVKFISQKIKKQKLNGRPGETDLYFNIATMRYYENKNGREVSPFDYLVKHAQIIESKLEPDHELWNVNKNIESNKDEAPF